MRHCVRNPVFVGIHGSSTDNMLADMLSFIEMGFLQPRCWGKRGWMLVFMWRLLSVESIYEGCHGLFFSCVTVSSLVTVQVIYRKDEEESLWKGYMRRGKMKELYKKVLFESRVRVAYLLHMPAVHHKEFLSVLWHLLWNSCMLIFHLCNHSCLGPDQRWVCTIAFN